MGHGVVARGHLVRLARLQQVEGHPRVPADMSNRVHAVPGSGYEVVESERRGFGVARGDQRVIEHHQLRRAPDEIEGLRSDHQREVLLARGEIQPAALPARQQLAQVLGLPVAGDRPDDKAGDVAAEQDCRLHRVVGQLDARLPLPVVHLRGDPRRWRDRRRHEAHADRPPFRKLHALQLHRGGTDRHQRGRQASRDPQCSQ